MNDTIRIRGAREHNLQNIDLTLPRNKLIVMTGLSGSGKSSLAFDTIYAEGQRRYVESLSSYARQFLGQMDKPDVDSIEGLSPAIAIDQKTTSRNPRSTVGTVTEIHDYLRLLYARAGTPHCPQCGQVIRQQSVDQIVDRVTTLGEGTKIQVLSPLVRARKGEHQKLLEDMGKQGYVRVRVDGQMYEIGDTPALNKQQKHTIGGPAGGAPGHGPPPHRLPGDRHALVRGTGVGQRHRWGGHAVFPELRLPGLWHLSGRAHPPHVFLQQSLWGVPYLLRTGHPGEGRS